MGGGGPGKGLQPPPPRKSQFSPTPRQSTDPGEGGKPSGQELLAETTSLQGGGACAPRTATHTPNPQTGQGGRQERERTAPSLEKPSKHMRIRMRPVEQHGRARTEVS